MKLLLILMGLLNGLFMLADGIHVTLKGKYIGPEKPGPWAGIFQKMNIDVFKMGCVFILYGLVWLIWVTGIWQNKDWAYYCGIATCVLTLWYLPVGTALSTLILLILFYNKQKILGG